MPLKKTNQKQPKIAKSRFERVLASELKSNEVLPDRMTRGKHAGKLFVDLVKTAEGAEYLKWVMTSDAPLSGTLTMDRDNLTKVLVEKYSIWADSNKNNRDNAIAILNRLLDELNDPADTKFTFGKYKGKTIEEVYSEDINYLSWLIRNNDAIYNKYKEDPNCKADDWKEAFMLKIFNYLEDEDTNSDS